MFFLLVYESFRRQKRRKLLAGSAMFLGVVVITAMMAVATDIGDKMSREMRTFGANILVYPDEDNLDVEVGGINLKPTSQGSFLQESDLPKIKTIFWRNNIHGFAPFLSTPTSLQSGPQQAPMPVEFTGTYFAKSVPAGTDNFVTGVRTTNPWWKVAGSWPRDDSSDVLIGAKLAAKFGVEAGSTVYLSAGNPLSQPAGNPQPMMVSGILTTGGAEDSQIIGSLHVAQSLADKPGAVRRVLVSALTKPEDSFARKDPGKLNAKDYDRWYCSPYANSIALQLREAIPHSRSEQIRQVAQNEGTVLSRISGLMWLLALAALVASVLAVSAAMTTTLIERRREISLMKSLGASDNAIASLFLAESGMLALGGGTSGFIVGALLARQIGASIFGTQIAVQPVLFPIALLLAILVAAAGSAASIQRAMRLDPGILLLGDL